MTEQRGEWPRPTGEIVARSRKGTLYRVKGGMQNMTCEGWRWFCKDGKVPELQRAVFKGNQSNVIKQYREWCNRPGTIYETTAKSRIKEAAAEREQAAAQTAGSEENDMADKTRTAEKPGAPGLPEKIYVLRYQEGRNWKLHKAYADGDAALSIAGMLNDAMMTSEQDGEWDVDELDLV